MSGLGSARNALVSLGSLGGSGMARTSSPHLLDVSMSPGLGLMTLPLPNQLPNSTPDMLAAALQHAGLIGNLVGPSHDQVWNHD